MSRPRVLTEQWLPIDQSGRSASATRALHRSPPKTSARLVGGAAADGQPGADSGESVAIVSKL